MSGLVYGADEAVAEWVSKQPYGMPFHPPFTTIGVVKDGRLTGGFVFSFKTHNSICLSLAGRGCVFSRTGWRAVLDYVFDQAKCSRMECRTSKRNKIVRECLPQLGFKFEGTARRLFGRDDGLCFSLTVDDLADFRKRWRL